MLTLYAIRTWLRRAAWFAAIVLATALAAVAVPHIRTAAETLLADRSLENRALEVLRSEPLRFLVTDRVAAQVVVERSDSNLALGKREGYLIAKVSLYYGVDLRKLGPEDLTREGPLLVVTVPEPEELDFAVDLASVRYLSRRSGLQIAADWLLDRDQEAELRTQFQDAARAYLRDQQLLPARNEIVRRLNAFAETIGGSVGTEVVFR